MKWSHYLSPIVGAFEMKVMLTLGSVLFHRSIWEGLLGTQYTNGDVLHYFYSKNHSYVYN